MAGKIMIPIGTKGWDALLSTIIHGRMPLWWMAPVLSSQTADPLKITDSFAVKKVSQPKPGIWVYDFGQNASGIFSIKVRGKKQEQVTFRPAELLTDEGLITQDAVGTPVFFNYTLKGENIESWQPQFTYYGFRYIQVEGAVPEGEPNPKNLPVIVSIKVYIHVMLLQKR